MNEIRLAALDSGNDALKGVFGDGHNRLWIPNVIAEEQEKRRIVELERNVLDGLHVKITSPALQDGGGVYVVGTLAMTYPHAKEVQPDMQKHASDQNLIVALTALAVDAAQTSQRHSQMIEARYALGSGLPVSEIKQGHKQRFIDRLTSGTHEVRFLSTPEYGGLTVRIQISSVLVYGEGHAAIIELTLDDENRLRSKEFAESPLLIADIGGQTSDYAIVDLAQNGKLDNYKSNSLKEGISPYLDRISQRVESEYGYRFQNRQDVVRTLTHPSPEKQNTVTFRRISIRDIVEEELGHLAELEYDFLRRMFRQVGDLELAYMVGGGSIILRPYLEHLNDDGYPLRFVENAESSVWLNAISYFRLLKMRHQRTDRG